MKRYSTLGIKKIVFGIALGTLSTVSVAETGKLYIGVGIGASELEPDTAGTEYEVNNSNSEGGKLYVGYDFHKKFSVEAYYSILGEAEISPTGSIEYEDMGIDGNFFFYGAGSGQPGLSLFGRAGIGQMKNSTELPYERSHDTHMMLGAGIQYGFKNGWALRADFDLYDTDSKLLAIGLNKHFGRSKETRRGLPTQVQIVEPKPTPVAQPKPKPTPRPEPKPVESIKTPAVATQPKRTAGPETFIPANTDLDNDGILNSRDKCPATKENTPVDKNGCKLPKIISLQGVRFATGSDKLIGESTKILDSVAKTLIAYTRVKIEVAGHTDSQGSKEVNNALSLRRAQAVKTYLGKRGISLDILTAKGYGESKPIADNATAKGRAANRRVELNLDYDVDGKL
jgi:OOP family OmpA-OmpF porin